MVAVTTGGSGDESGRAIGHNHLQTGLWVSGGERNKDGSNPQRCQSGNDEVNGIGNEERHAIALSNSSGAHATADSSYFVNQLRVTRVRSGSFAAG